MRILIDATTAEPAIRVFGLSLVEHQLQSLRRSLLAIEEVRVLVAGAGEEVPADHPARRAIDEARLENLPVRWEGTSSSLIERVGAALQSAPQASWLIFAGDTIVDARLVAQLAAASGNLFFAGGEGNERGAILRLDAGTPLPADPAPSGASVLAIAESLERAGRARSIRRDEFDGYIVKLRRELDPYLFPVRSEAARQRVERFLFWSNYKGSTDFMTKYVWPPLVWALVRPLARARVHPNVVTGISIVATLTAIPCWMFGAWGTGFFLAYLMSLLDSVDGKLARLTYTYSPLGNLLDHGLDIVHPPFWYLGWAYGLSGGDMQSGVGQASLWMFGLYVADRLFAPVFKWRTGRSIHGYLPIDVTIRTFISRRNVNLPFFTAAVVLDLVMPGESWTLAIPVFYAIVIWQAVCAVYHGVRTVQFFHVRKGRVEKGTAPV